MKFQTIETNRLLLKGLTPNEIKHIFDNLKKREIKEILGHLSEEDYLKEENKHKNGYSSYNRSFKLFLLSDKQSGNIIGRCGLHNWNTEHMRAEIGYIMQDDKFKRQGLMSEAVSAVIDHGFNEMRLNRIEALVGNGNIPSLRLLEKNNFIREGILRQHVQVSGIYEDSILFSRLSGEYHAEKSIERTIKNSGSKGV